MQASRIQSLEATKSASRGQSQSHPGDAPWTEQTFREVNARCAETALNDTATETEFDPEQDQGDDQADASFRGTSPGFSIPNLLQFLGTNRKTGTLQVKSPTENFTIAMKDGMIIYAWSSPRPMEERLGSILLDRCLVEPDRLGELIEQSRETNSRLGDILHEQNLVSTEDLKSALAYQIELMFRRLFATVDATFGFFEEEPEARNFHVRMGVMELLLESARVIDEAR